MNFYFAKQNSRFIVAIVIVMFIAIIIAIFGNNSVFGEGTTGGTLPEITPTNTPVSSTATVITPTNTPVIISIITPPAPTITPVPTIVAVPTPIPTAVSTPVVSFEFAQLQAELMQLRSQIDLLVQFFNQWPTADEQQTVIDGWSIALEDFNQQQRIGEALMNAAQTAIAGGSTITNCNGCQVVGN